MAQIYSTKHTCCGCNIICILQRQKQLWLVHLILSCMNDKVLRDHHRIRTMHFNQQTFYLLCPQVKCSWRLKRRMTRVGVGGCWAGGRRDSTRPTTSKLPSEITLSESFCPKVISHKGSFLESSKKITIIIIWYLKCLWLWVQSDVICSQLFLNCQVLRP